MNYGEHGGGCCGISHVSNFPYECSPIWETALDRTLDESYREIRENVLQNYIDTISSRRGWHDESPLPEELPKNWKVNHLIKVVLTDQQMLMWAETLKKKGFRLVTRFLNSNSGNHCNVLHLTTGAKTRTKRPFKW